MKTMKITYWDLNAEARTRYLETVGAEDESDLNPEIPIAILEIEEESS